MRVLVTVYELDFESECVESRLTASMREYYCDLSIHQQNQLKNNQWICCMITMNSFFYSCGVGISPSWSSFSSKLHNITLCYPIQFTCVQKICEYISINVLHNFVNWNLWFFGHRTNFTLFLQLKPECHKQNQWTLFRLNVFSRSSNSLLSGGN